MEEEEILVTNVEFRKGDIEKKIPVKDNSVDVVISNCVINLATDKVSTFKEIYRILKKGGTGRMVISDLVTDTVVIDAKVNGVFGVPFIAFAPFVGVAIGVYLFGKISMAQFNPAVTFGFLITRHITRIQLVYYFTAEIVGALFGSLFVKYALGNQANLGANAPNYSYPIAVIFGVERQLC